MADNPTTAPTAPAETGEPQAPPATPAPKEQGSATEDKTVTLSEKDYKNLVSARDKANNDNAATNAYVMEMAKKDEITDWLKENKKDYPDVSIDDLMAADSEDALPKLAAKTQRRIEDAVQARLKNVQRASAPTLSPEDRAAKLKALSSADRPDDAFEQFVGLQMTPTS